MIWIERAGLATPWFFVAVFLAASFLMIWRLESMAADGMEGTVLGTLVMPYCTGMGNLIFAIVLGMHGGSGAEVMTNCLVNNVTNLTLLVGLPAALWGMAVLPDKAAKSGQNCSHHLNRLSMMLTLMAVLFFTSTAWVVGRRHEIGLGEGLILVGLFLCWQSFHVFEVLKSNRRQNKTFGRMLVTDLVLLGVGTYGTYVSTDWLVSWLSNIKTGFISARYMGWLSGWLDVLPNGLMAFYYGWRRQAEVVYTSQVGDAHICIPLCIGIFALYKPIVVPPIFETGVLILGGATLVHLIFIGTCGRLPQAIGWLLTAAYAVFLYKGLIK
ncbi:MAG: sodium:calcium symporter [Limisphaerales bacterium]